MRGKDVVVLKKIVSYCDQIEEALDMFGRDYEKFKTISTFRNACCMCVMQIGELCKVISDDLRSAERDIPWKGWCGIRDIFAHQYTSLDLSSAWDAIIQDAPILKARAKHLLSESAEEGRVNSDRT